MDSVACRQVGGWPSGRAGWRAGRHTPILHPLPSRRVPPEPAADDNFVKLVMGKLGPQQAFLMRKLKIAGSMALAMKLQPILVRPTMGAVYPPACSV